MRNRLFFALAALMLFQSAGMGQEPNKPLSMAARIDGYLDLRQEAKQDATEKLLTALAQEGLRDPRQLEAALRSRRAGYPDTKALLGKISKVQVKCYHVDYESHFLLYVPKSLNMDKPISLVVVGHGGNSSMSQQRAEATAAMYLRIYGPPLGQAMNTLVAAPVSARGWGHIGNSLILSTISRVQRMFPIDPDRLYVTGQSMGGHMTYRAALSLADRWGAVSPHSGGYDYVEKKSIGNLLSVPGYAIWGVREPFGINTDNRTNAEWGKSHGLHWTFVEKNGGHTIYQDELPKMAAFFVKNPRNLYRKQVYLRLGGAMKFVKTWNVKGWPKHQVRSDTRPLRWNLRHWVQVEPRSDQQKPLELLAQNHGNNRIEITSNNVRQMTIYLHPKMADLTKPLQITINGKAQPATKVQTNPQLMFDLAREFDDRGRIFWAAVKLKVDTDQEVALPKQETNDANRSQATLPK